MDRNAPAEDVVERALAVLADNSREWTDEQKRVYSGAVEQDPDHDV